ncbi:MAG: lytic transglycosylase domain-containing protein, partial [Candidatus Binatia bacterium]
MAKPTRRAPRTAIQVLLAASTAALLGTACSRQLDSASGPSVLVALPSPPGSAPAVTPEPLAGLQSRERRSRWANELYDPLIVEYADLYGVEFELVKAMIHAESSFDPHAVSHRGARGLMQLMPRTARSYGARDLHDPRENIRVGVVHLRSLLDRFGSLPLAIAAYN